ncbi:MAG TPA: histidine kinase dimerization/phospho-acceptor domain-containing protein [Thermoanaerobaculia bacterium]|nr:histidine kinase dimerization/phospho-acceptor domain-containing protein [Thermoanaerobaculia bacterium]
MPESRNQNRTASPPPSRVLAPGVVILGDNGGIRSADPRALALLGCANRDLERRWSEIRPQLEAQGFRLDDGDGPGSVALPLGGPDGQEPARHLLFDLRGTGEGSVLLIHDADVNDAWQSDLRLSSQMRSLSQISPAVAHDLRAPINAMVFNIEILKETVASGRGAEPAIRDRQLRYVNVLKEELSRLHRSLEIFLAHISPRGDRVETVDLRELMEEFAALLVAPARKQQVQVQADLPDDQVPVEGSRYLLRQAFLHLGLAALARLPKQGTLEILLEHMDDRARIEIGGDADPEAAPLPGFDIQVSPDGTLSQLWVARSLLAAHGGEVRVPEASAGASVAFEVELRVSEKD